MTFHRRLAILSLLVAATASGAPVPLAQQLESEAGTSLLRLSRLAGGRDRTAALWRLADWEQRRWREASPQLDPQDSHARAALDALQSAARDTSFAQHPDVLADLGDLHQACGRPVDARRLWAEVATRHPLSQRAPDAALSLGDDSLEQRDLSAARRWYDLALALSERSGRSELLGYATYLRAWVDLGTGDFAAAGRRLYAVARTESGALGAQARADLIAAAARDASQNAASLGDRLDRIAPLTAARGLRAYAMAVAERGDDGTAAQILEQTIRGPRSTGGELTPLARAALELATRRAAWAEVARWTRILLATREVTGDPDAEASELRLREAVLALSSSVRARPESAAARFLDPVSEAYFQHFDGAPSALPLHRLAAEAARTREDWSTVAEHLRWVLRRIDATRASDGPGWKRPEWLDDTARLALSAAGRVPGIKIDDTLFDKAALPSVPRSLTPEEQRLVDIAALCEQLWTTSDDGLRATLIRGRVLAGAGHLLTVGTMLSSVSAQRPASPVAPALLWMSVRAFQSVGAWDRIVETTAAARGAGIDPHHRDDLEQAEARALLTWSASESAAGHHDRALKRLESVIRSGPPRWRAAAALASADWLSTSGDLTEAVRLRRLGLALLPGPRRVSQTKGSKPWPKRDEGDPTVVLDPALLWRTQARDLDRLGRFDEALEALGHLTALSADERLWSTSLQRVSAEARGQVVPETSTSPSDVALQCAAEAVGATGRIPLVPPFDRSLSRRLRERSRAQSMLQRIMDGPASDSAICAWVLAGRMDAALAAAFLSAPIPRQLDATQRQLFQHSVEKEAAPVQESAWRAYDQALRLAAGTHRDPPCLAEARAARRRDDGPVDTWIRAGLTFWSSTGEAVETPDPSGFPVDAPTTWWLEAQRWAAQHRPWTAWHVAGRLVDDPVWGPRARLFQARMLDSVDTSAARQAWAALATERTTDAASRTAPSTPDRRVAALVHLAEKAADDAALGALESLFETTASDVSPIDRTTVDGLRLLSMAAAGRVDEARAHLVALHNAHPDDPWVRWLDALARRHLEGEDVGDTLDHLAAERWPGTVPAPVRRCLDAARGRAPEA